MLRIELMRVDGIEPAPGGGERDPFVYFKVGDGDEEATSSKVLGTSEPTWDPPEVRRFCSFLFASLFFCFSYATRGSSVLFFSVRFAFLQFCLRHTLPGEAARSERARSGRVERARIRMRRRETPVVASKAYTHTPRRCDSRRRLKYPLPFKTPSPAPPPTRRARAASRPAPRRRVPKVIELRVEDPRRERLLISVYDWDRFFEVVISPP